MSSSRQAQNRGSNSRMARIRAWILAKLPFQHIAVLFASTGTFAAGVVLGWNSVAGYLLHKKEMDQDSLRDDDADPDHLVSDAQKVVSIVAAGGYLGALLPMLALLGCRGVRAQLAVAYVLLLFIGWLCVCNANMANMEYTLTMVGRCFSGIGVGIFLTVLPIFIGEIASPRHRDRLLFFAYTALSCGIAVAYAFAFAGIKFEDLPIYNLRCALVCLPTMLCGTMMYFDPVESVAGGREDEARTALGLYESNDETYVNKKMEELRELVKKDVAPKPYSYRQLIALLILTLCHQLSGASVVMFNALFLVGRSNRMTMEYFTYTFDELTSISVEQCQICAFSQIVANLLGFLLIGLLGRRTLLYLSGVLMALTMGTIAFILETSYYNPSLAPTILAAYYAAYGLGFGPIIWGMLADSFPISLRLNGASIVASIGWLVSLLLNMHIDTLIKELATILLWIFAGFSLLGAFVGVCFVKETRKKSLLDLERQFFNS